MRAKIITINRTKYLNHFSLCALNLFNTRVSQFELNYWNKLTFPRHSNLLRCTCSSFLIGWNSQKNRDIFTSRHLGWNLALSSLKLTFPEWYQTLEVGQDILKVRGGVWALTCLCLLCNISSSSSSVKLCCVTPERLAAHSLIYLSHKNALPSHPKWISINASWIPLLFLFMGQAFIIE